MRWRFGISILVGLACIYGVGAEAAPSAEPDPSDPMGGKNHWAFQPLRTHRPGAGSRSWATTQIDDFLFDGLEKVKLQPAADAEPRLLLRRVYFRLVGLPPSPEEMEAFLEDKRPDAFARVVDRLLASPQFGERWGRHWLDLARYADSNGLDENFLFREAWRYRNWVINALNADMPFDRFVLEQIAGDILPFASIEQRDRQRIAAGFLVIGPKVLLGNDVKKQRMEVADEQVDTIGRALLGLTVGCARCHDHKFEPVPADDYYALAGIFTSTDVMEQRYMLGEQRVMERLIGLGVDGDAADARYEQYWLELPKLKERSKQAKSALEFLEKGDASGLDAIQQKNPDAITDSATNSALSMPERIEAQKTFSDKLNSAIAKPPSIPPRAMIPGDGKSPEDEKVRIAGQFDRLGRQVPRGFLRVIGHAEGVKIPQGQSGRAELGRWLTDMDGGAGPLVARVLVNRIWQHMVGEGLVRTVDNFGRTGETPSHPQLLDYLARELANSGWSTKALVRKIALSRAFSMSSEHSASAYEVDPENRLLWRAHRRRLDPESLRDAMLSAAGQLNLSQMDSTVWYLGDQATAVGKNEVRRRTDFACRSVYLPIIRNDLPDLFEAFDFANPHVTTGARPQTTAVTQGLFMLNSDMVIKTSDVLARRILSDPALTTPSTRVDRMFDVIRNTPPTDDERSAVVAFMDESKKRLAGQGDADPALHACSLACQSIFSLSNFQFLE